MSLVPGFARCRPLLWKNAVGIILFRVAAISSLFLFTRPAISFNT